MNTKVILIGLGVVAVAAGAYFIFRKPTAASGSGKSLDTGGLPTDQAPVVPIAPSSDLGMFDTSLFGAGSTGTVVDPKSRKEIRRDCRQEARAKCGTGLGKGKPKCRRNYRRDCKAAGGFDDGGADFAFNGYEDWALN